MRCLGSGIVEGVVQDKGKERLIEPGRPGGTGGAQKDMYEYVYAYVYVYVHVEVYGYVYV